MWEVTRRRPPPLAAMAPWILTAVALALRLYHLGRHPFWHDEAYSALESLRSMGSLLARLRHEAGAPLYFILMHPWESLVGEGAFALRLGSALAGTAAVPVLYLVGARMFSRRAGLIAASLAVVSPIHLHYSQEFRMYAAVALLALVVLYAIHHLTERPSAASALFVSLLFASGFYLHYFFLFLTPLMGMALFASDQRRSLWAGAAALGASLLMFSPWLGTLFHQAAGPSTEWIGEAWQHWSLLSAVPRSLECLGPAARYPPFVTFHFRSSALLGAVSLGLSVVVLFAAARVIVRGWPGRESRALLLTVSAVLVPLLCAFLVSLARRPIYVVARYDLISWGPYLLLLGAVAGRFGRRTAAGLVIAWVVLATFTLRDFWSMPSSDAGLGMPAQVLRRVSPGETVVFGGGARTMSEFHLHAHRGDYRLASYPRGDDDHLGWTDQRLFTDPVQEALEAHKLAWWLLAGGRPAERIWLANIDTGGHLVATLRRMGYRRDQRHSAPGLQAMKRGWLKGRRPGRVPNRNGKMLPAS